MRKLSFILILLIGSPLLAANENLKVQTLTQASLLPPATHSEISREILRKTQTTVTHKPSARKKIALSS